VEKTNRFIEDLVVDLSGHGANLPIDEIRLASLQFTSAIKLMILTPRHFAKNIDLNLCDESSRKLIVDRLVDPPTGFVDQSFCSLLVLHKGSK